MTDEVGNALVEEMRTIKKLLMLQALAVGYKQKDLASALGIGEATVSRMLPKGLTRVANVRGVTES